MTSDAGQLMLNVSSFVPPVKKSKEKLSRVERIRKKKLERKSELEPYKTDSKVSQSNQDTRSTKRPHPGDESSPSKKARRPPQYSAAEEASLHKPSTNRGHFVSIFTNNPDIPHMQRVNVDPVKEKVFTGKSFGDTELHPHLVCALASRLNVKEMTRVQQQTIPAFLGGQDILLKSQTGSGKTLAYCIPLIHKLQSLTPRVERIDGAYAIIIVPTRELALQTLDTLQKLVYAFTWIVPGCIMGGEQKKREKARLRKGINVLVATPGRLIDHLEHTTCLGLTALRWLVIDEADRLLQLGFQKEVAKVINVLRENVESKPQTILLSATLSPGVESLVGMSLENHILIDAKSDPDAPETETTVTESGTGDFALPEKLQHHYILVPLKLRLVTLAAFLLWKCKMVCVWQYAAKRSKVLVFFATLDCVEFFHSLFTHTLCRHDNKSPDLEVFKLHGDIAQKERMVTFRKFSEATSGVLFCTDVAARGLDLPQVRWIIQFHPAASATDYIHRVGRTARIGSRGSALLFLAPNETGYVKVLTDHKVSIEEASMDDILKTLLVEADRMPRGPGSTSGAPRTVQESAAALQNQLTHYVQHNEDARTAARKAYQSCVRAYSAYPAALKHIFHVRSLHLGHLATSFCLTDAPKTIGSAIGKQALRKSKQSMKKEEPKSAPKKTLTSMSEFDSGLTPKPHKTKKSKH